MTATRTGQRRLGDRYRLVEELGRGGMSVVWRGYDELIEREVAVKLLSPSVDARFRAAVRAEARAAGRLTNAHITHVYDYGEAADDDGVTTPYLVMELVEGESLSRRLTDRHVLPWREAAGIGAQVATALAAAHARGLAHRDVKPDNVILTDEGVKVVDFGISAIIGDPDATEDGQLVGTPAYVAPERLADVPVGPAADVYALGVLLYRSLTGYLPWEADGRTAMLRAHMFVEPVALPPDSGLPHDLIDAVHECLDKDPGNRPSAIDLATRLSALAIARNGRNAWDTDEPAPVRRRSVLVPALVAVFLALFAGAWAFANESRSDPAPAAAGTGSAGCAARFSVDRDWGKGFDAHVTVTNSGPATVDRWQVSFAFPGDQRVAPAPASAPAVLRQDGTTVTASARTPGQAIAPYASVAIPLSVSYTVDNRIPTRVDLNSTPCQTVITGPAYRPATAQPAAPRTTQPGDGGGDGNGGDGNGDGHGHGHGGGDGQGDG